MAKRWQHIIAVLLMVLLFGGTTACSIQNNTGTEDTINSTNFNSGAKASTLTPEPTGDVSEKPTANEDVTPSFSPSFEREMQFPAETQTPEPVPVSEVAVSTVSSSSQDKAASYVASMSEKEKIFQLFIVNPDVVTGVSGTIMAGDITKETLEAYPVGGFVYQLNNIVDLEQLQVLISGQQQYMEEAGYAPLLTCVDEEGGTVTRLHGVIEGTLNSMYSYEQEGLETARNNAIKTSLRLKEVGLNTNFAPVADVWSNDANSVIGPRAYSKDFNTAAELVAAAVQGFREENIICTLKHFPGHGDTVQDSHEMAAIVTKSREELITQEFLPFSSGIQAGADMVMIGHLTVEALDENGTPATFSQEIITGILRNELNFEGVVITDSLLMNAATEVVSGGEACVRALEAGCDILLGPANSQQKLEECYQTILGAVNSGRLSWDRIDVSVCRIIALKFEHGIL